MTIYQTRTITINDASLALRLVITGGGYIAQSLCETLTGRANAHNKSKQRVKFLHDWSLYSKWQLFIHFGTMTMNLTYYGEMCVISVPFSVILIFKYLS